MALSPNSFVTAQTPKVGYATIANADGTTLKDLFSGGANGSKVTAVSVASIDTAARVAQLYIYDGTTAHLVGSASIPLAAGTDGATPSVDLLGATLNPGLPFDNDGMHYLFVPSGSKLQVGVVAAMTAAKTLSVTAIGGDF